MILTRNTVHIVFHLKTTKELIVTLTIYFICETNCFKTKILAKTFKIITEGEKNKNYNIILKYTQKRMIHLRF